ncbi:MAG: ATP synthase F1 subunit gamma [Flavobacteriales bacterium]
MAGGLKEVKNRIVSVQSTIQITSAMKMVSAAKLRRAQDAVTKMRPYAEKLQEILANVSSSLDSSEGVYSAERPLKNILVVAITSNRGLCGGFNNNIIKETNRLIAENKGVNIHVLSLGKKASDAYKASGADFTDGFGDKPFGIFDDLSFPNASKIASTIMEQFSDGRWDAVHLIYNQFKNAAVQIVQREQFLPAVPAESDEAPTSNVDYVFEPSKEEIVNNIIPNSLKVQLFKALLDSFASEHGARMTAMHKATDNAKDLVKELKLQYNKARQASITNEILEIVAGAEALS